MSLTDNEVNSIISNQIKSTFVSFCNFYSKKKTISQETFDFAHDLRDQIIKNLENVNKNPQGLEKASA